MKNMNLLDKKIVFRFWAVMDLLHIAIYIYATLESGFIPYSTDMLNSLSIYIDIGDPMGILFIIFHIFLEFSIVLSLFLLLFLNKYTKLLCYIQIPFRLFLSISSIPFILSIDPPVPLVIAISWSLISEILKILSLKYAK